MDTGILRLRVNVNTLTNPIFYRVKDVDHAKTLANALADSFLLEEDDGGFNFFDLEIIEDGEWVSWQSDDGDTFDDVMSQEEND